MSEVPVNARRQGRLALVVIAIGATISLVNLVLSYRASPEGILP